MQASRTREAETFEVDQEIERQIARERRELERAEAYLKAVEDAIATQGSQDAPAYHVERMIEALTKELMRRSGHDPDRAKKEAQRLMDERRRQELREKRRPHSIDDAAASEMAARALQQQQQQQQAQPGATATIGAPPKTIAKKPATTQPQTEHRCPTGYAPSGAPCAVQ